MSGFIVSRALRSTAVGGALLGSMASAYASGDNGLRMTAGVILNEMSVRERTSYVMGIVDAMAYARFVKDTERAGENDPSGMECIYGWFHDDGVGRMRQVDAAFGKYGDHLPSMVIAALVQRECGA